ncbi:8-oxo-dGTP diphosphatase [Anaerocolumna jejuensis]|uniref:8-oxo-dGTP diphosphatase n=1 Tax=Anaerocolumna jejuensis TaxID=259063 RepID=UPI003F7CC17C
MDRSERAVFTNMCMIYDNNGKVLVQDRKDPEWGGITFPGGHVEKEESFPDAVIREVYEETGLTVFHPQLCGIKQFMQSDGSRYVVLFYKTNKYTGDIVSSKEGDIYWTRLEELKDKKLADGMDRMLQVFLDEDISELYWYKADGLWKNELK